MSKLSVTKIFKTQMIFDKSNENVDLLKLYDEALIKIEKDINGYRNKVPSIGIKVVNDLKKIQTEKGILLYCFVVFEES